MDNKKVIIIGSGISGLSAGCYLQMNGYDTEIFEMHENSGGLCTSWKRNDYTFNGCIRWLDGVNPEREMHKIWSELGAFKDRPVITFDIFTCTNLGNGDIFCAYTDPEALKNEMLRIAPEDSELIEEFITAINLFRLSKPSILKPQELQSYAEYMKENMSDLPVRKVMDKWGKLSTADFQRKFKNPILKQHFPVLFGLYSNLPFIQIIYTLATFANRDAGYPVGGSFELIKSIEEKYIGLGGKIHFNSRIKKIIIEKNKAVGVHLNDGSNHKSDIVISAADGYDTLFNMLEGKYMDAEMAGFYKRGKTFPSIVQVHLGLSKDYRMIPPSVFINIPLKESLLIDEKNKYSHLQITLNNFDPTLVPEGKTTISALFNADYEYWTKLKKENLGDYRREKKRIAETVIDILEENLGNIKDNIEIYDVATPDTYIRCTNNWKGSYEGWLVTTGNYGKRFKMVLPGLQNFYMIGQWIQPGGGVPTGAIQGRHLAQIICFMDHKEFKIPED